MKDRYKYRVWDKENKYLHYPTRYNNFAIVNGTVVKIESYPTANSAYLGKRIAWEFDDAVIMQSTGLKDKNGKLIYEGDIVKTEAQAGIVINYGIVGFNEKEARFLMTANLKSQDYIYSFWYRDSLEVIGNIYENKELLNENS